MESVEAQVVETPEPELTDMAKAMLGVAQVETPADKPPTPPDTETQAAEPATETAPDEEVAPETETAPKTIKQLAEKLGIKASELYDITVNMPDGAEISLGALKDQYQQADTLTSKQDALDERRTAFDTEMSAKHTELADLAQVIDPASLTPEQRDAYGQFVQQRSARELSLLLSTTPEWKDSVQREADQQLMRKHVARYNMSKGELDGVTSHKMIRIIRDAALAAQRKAKTPPKGQKPTRTPIKPRDDLATIVADAKSGKRTERQALGDVLRAQR